MNRIILAIKVFFKALTSPKVVTQALQLDLDATKKPDANLKTLEKKEKKDKKQSHLQLLADLQAKGRFIDFMKEDISDFDDEQIGAAVRKIHADCSSCIEELVTVRPVFQQEEGESLEVPVGYNTDEIKVTGSIKGEPPYSCILVHKGWKAHKESLPKKEQVNTKDFSVIYPAEVEIKE